MKTVFEIPVESIIGLYNRTGYRICIQDEQGLDEIYTAGNSPCDSQQTVPVGRGLPLRKMRSMCIQSAKEEAKERGIPYLGIEREEEDDEGF
jgi:hypothetical protein